MLYFVILDKSKLFGIKRSDIFGWQIFFKSLLLSDCKNELDETFKNIVRFSLLGFRPQKRFDHEIDIAQLCVGKILEKIVSDRIFQRL